MRLKKIHRENCISEGAQASNHQRSIEPVKLSAHYLKPLLNRQRRLDVILDLVARLAVRAARKRLEQPVEVSPVPSDTGNSTLTSQETHVMFRPKSKLERR